MGIDFKFKRHGFDFSFFLSSLWKLFLRLAKVMSGKRKGLSADDKRRVVLSVYHDKLVVV